jgi:hypothetical integral membrane protein (TIGR02206 family)
MDIREFQPCGASHWVALGVTLAAGAALVGWFRRTDLAAADKRRMRHLLALLLCVAVALDPVLVWLRYGDHPAEAWRWIIAGALPLHLCDVVSLLLAWALVSGSQRLAEPGYFWSMAATTQGLITPALPFDWQTPEYYAFFAEHSGAPIAGLVLVFGMGLGPRPGYFLRMLWWSWGYMAVVMGFNALVGTNYGFLNGKPEGASLLDRLGPWPYYLIPLQAIGLAMFLLLGWLAVRLGRRFPLPSRDSPEG